nr:retrovirus-related Pol polyprotein from transposon TNT 1-94 [Tanacetum cinerariifolium]
MSTQQDIYAAVPNRPPMLNKDNYVPWSSCIIIYAKSRPNGKMIVDSIENGPYRDADDQAIQTILLGLPEDIYAAVDSCETAKEIWERVRQMMKGSDIGEQEKKAKLFNEWEKFTSTDRESIESYYHCFMKLMTDLKRNKHFPENIALNLKFFNNLQLEWKRHVTIVRQRKNLHEADFTQIYDFLKMNQDEVNELRGERIAKSHESLALMAHSQNSLNFPTTHKDQSSFNINDPTKAINVALILFAKAFQLTTPTNNNQRNSSNPRNRQIAQPVMNISQDRKTQNVRGNGGNQFGQYAGQVAQNQQGYNAWQNGGIQVAQNAGVQSGGLRALDRCYNCRGLGHIARNCTARPRRRDAAYIQTQLLIAQKEEAWIQLQHASTSGTQLDKALVYDIDGSTEVQPNDNCYDNEIFNMFTQEEQYTDLLEPIPEPKLVPQNDNHVTYVALRVFVPQTTKSKEELFLSNVSNMVIVSKMISIPNEDLLDDTTPSVARKFLNEKLELKIVELEFQVVNYEPEISHLKTTYKNLFDSIASNRAHAKLHNLIYENAKLRARLFENTSEPMKNTSGTSVTPHECVAPGMFKINPSQTPRVDLVPNKQSSASIRTNPITNSQRHVTFKENVSSDMVTASSTGLVHTARTRRPQPKGNTKNARIPPASKSSEVKKIVTVEDHRRTLLLSNNQKTMSSESNKNKLAIRNDKSEIVCDTCKKCLVTANHDACLPSSVNALNSRANKLCANDPPSANQKRHRTHVGNQNKLFEAYDREHQASHQLCVEVFGNCLGHNLFSVGQFCDADLEVTFRRNTCFIRDLDGVDLLKGNRSTNLYTINLYDMASASPICLMVRETPTKSWLWHQRLSHLNFDTINDLAKNDLDSGLPKFKYAKEHLCPSCEPGKSKRASYPPKPIPNLMHLLHMDLCGPMRVVSINGKRYVLVIVDDYSRYTWVHFLKTKDETIEEYFNSVGITHESSAAKTPHQNGVIERRNRTLFEATRTMLILSHALLFLWAEAIATVCYTQNRSIIHRRFNKTPYELIQGRKSYIPYLHVFGALCYPKNDCEDFGKLGTKGDIGFFIGYSANSVAYIVYNRRTKKIMKTMNVTFDELSAMAFEQNSSRHGLQSMTSGQINSELELTYAPSTITPQRPSERDLDILFEPLHNEYLDDSAPVPTNSLNTPVSSHNVDTNLQQHAQQQRNLTPSPTASAADNVPNATVEEALTDPAWIESMQEELHQFIRLDVWELVSSPDGIKPLTLKWLFKNKHDEENTVIRNKTRLVVRGYRQEEGTVWVKASAESMVRRAVYISLTNGFSKGTIDPTLFTRRFDDDILVDSGFVLTGFSDADYAGCKDTFKSTSGGAQFLDEKLVSWSSKKQDYIAINREIRICVSICLLCSSPLDADIVKRLWLPLRQDPNLL